MRRPAALFLTLGLGVAVTAGCGGNGTEPQPDVTYGSIEISAPADTVAVGRTLQFTAVVRDTAGNAVASPRLTWTSSDPVVASVSSLGRVLGRREGTAVIVAAGGGVTSDPETLVVVQGFGWVNQSGAANVTNRLNGVFFHDRLRGWVVGDLGTALFTADGGLSWTRQSSRSTSYRLNSVFFTTAQRGFAVGSTGRILETVNGGGTWNPRLGIDTDARELRDVFFLGEDLGFIVGDGGVILRTVDGGALWARYLPAVTMENLASVWVADVPGPDTLAWAVGRRGTVVGTRDAGRSWYVYGASGTDQDLRGVVRRSRTEAVAAGAVGTVVRTIATADSATWGLTASPGAALGLNDVAWPAVDRLFVAGFNSASGLATIYLSRNRGGSWTIQSLASDAPLPSNQIRGIWFVDEHHGWAVGEGGLILHTATGGSP